LRISTCIHIVIPARRHRPQAEGRPDGLALYTTNVAYGSADRRDLYITESYSATILRARVDVPGRQMFSHL
jgi:hypothetical protein